MGTHVDERLPHGIRRTLSAMPMRTFSDIACMPVGKGEGRATVNGGEGDERLLWRRFVQRLSFLCSAPDHELLCDGLHPCYSAGVRLYGYDGKMGLRRHHMREHPSRARQYVRLSLLGYTLLLSTGRHVSAAEPRHTGHARPL
jgi:hypothetical protein